METDLCFQKWHEEFCKFSPEHIRKCEKLDFSWVLLSKIENVWAQNLEGEQRGCQLENLKNLDFNDLLLTKAYDAWAKKKCRGVMFDCTEDWCKTWRQTYLYFLKWHEEFGKFSPDHILKSKNLVFSWVLFSKVENVSTWNLQGSYMSWEWRRMQNLIRNWLVNSKLIWVIW